MLLTGHIQLIPNFTEEEPRKAILTTEMTVKDLLETYKVDDTVNRDIRYDRVLKLEKYLEQMDTELGIYIPAIIVAYEGREPEVDYGKRHYLFEREKNFVVLDGQHRIKALERYIKKGNNQDKVGRILKSKITLQVYFNLTEQEKRQLFIEINGKPKRVSKNVTVKYDDRNPTNTLVTDLLKNKNNNPLLKMGVEQERTRVVRPGNKNWISMIRLSRFISYLILGTVSPSVANTKIISDQYEEVFTFLQQFFLFLESSLPKEPGNVELNILGHEAIQNTIALVCHRNIIRKEKNELVFNDNWKQFVEMLEYVDWGTETVLFKDHLVLSGTKKNYVRFSDNKHYDLLPLLEKELTELLE